MLLTGSTTNPLPLWLELGPELVDVLAGDGMLGDGVCVTLKGNRKKEKKDVDFSCATHL